MASGSLNISKARFAWSGNNQLSSIRQNEQNSSSKSRRLIQRMVSRSAQALPYPSVTLLRQVAFCHSTALTAVDLIERSDARGATMGIKHLSAIADLASEGV